MRKARRLPLIATLLTVVGWCLPVWAATEVDLALVLAVDISNSMDPEEQELQRDGLHRGIPVADRPRRDPERDPRPDRRGLHGMGRHSLQKVVVPWTVIDEFRKTRSTSPSG